jgi:lipoyl(octanoyl) transferase
MRKCEVRHCGRVDYTAAFAMQREFVDRRKRGEIPDQLLFVEHPHVITLGRNGRMENLLASEEVIVRAGIQFCETDRGGDITYHGPGQIVGYPIFDLRDWKRDVAEYLRAMEQAIIDALSEFGIESRREPGATGVWTAAGKICAIGVHISRWVTSHGFALNHATDLSYFQYIVPCGLTKPVTSMRALNGMTSRPDVEAALTREFSKQFDFEMIEIAEPALVMERTI